MVFATVAVEAQTATPTPPGPPPATERGPATLEILYQFHTSEGEIVGCIGSKSSGFFRCDAGLGKIDVLLGSIQTFEQEATLQLTHQSDTVVVWYKTTDWEDNLPMDITPQPVQVIAEVHADRPTVTVVTLKFEFPISEVHIWTHDDRPLRVPSPDLFQSFIQNAGLKGPACCLLIVKNANVRVGPSTSFALLATATDGDIVSLIETDEITMDTAGYRWWKVGIAEGGWIRGDLTSRPFSCSDAQQVQLSYLTGQISIPMMGGNK